MIKAVGEVPTSLVVKLMISSNPNQIRQLDSLFTVLQKRASSPPDEVLNPLDNVIVSDYTVGIERELFDTVWTSFQAKQERIESGSGEHFSADEWDHLRFFCSRLRTSEMEVINAKKRATETTTLLSNQFDAGQVISLVKQIPSLLQKELDSILGEVVANMAEALEQAVSLLPLNQKHLILSCHPLLGKLRAFEVAKITNIVSDRLASLIENVVIPTRNNDPNQQEGENNGASLRDVESMLGSLITVSDPNTNGTAK